MRRSTWLRTGLFLVFGAVLLCAATPGWAQAVLEGTITGTVMETTGAVIPGAALKLTGPALVTGERTATSGPEGKFIFMSVPPGTYALTATMKGFKTATVEGLVVERGKTVDVPFQMEIGKFEEQIVVTAETVMMDTRSSTVSTTFDDKLLAKVPTSRNPFYDLALTAPGMGSVGAEQSWLPSPTAYGSANSQNIMLVNGVNATNPRGSSWGSMVAVNYNTVEEVKLLSLGTKAEYGNYSGAAIDVITKSGGNEFHGDVSYYTMVGNAADNSTTTFSKSWLFADPTMQINWGPISNKEPSITLGGPIVKDKLWFYAGASQPKSEGHEPLYTLNTNSESSIYDLKLTGEFGVNHRAWLGLHYEEVKGYNTTWGYGWDPSMIYNTKTPGYSGQFQYQWVVGPTDILGFKYLAFDSKENPSIPAEIGHPGYVNWGTWVPVRDAGVNGDFPWIEGDRSKRQTFQADISHYAEDFLGSHDLKFGVQYTKADGNYIGGYFQNYSNSAYPYGSWYFEEPAADWPWNQPGSEFFFTCDPPCWPVYNRVTRMNPYLTVRNSHSTGVFADDTWAVNNRFTVNLGLRYDRQTAGYGTGDIYEPMTPTSDIDHLTVQRERGGKGTVYDFKTWSPRIGIAWTATEDAKTVLRAHYGRYYAAMGIESLRTVGPDQDPFVEDTSLYKLPASVVDVNGNGYWDPEETITAMRAIYGRTPDLLMSSSVANPSFSLEVAPGTGSPYTDQFNVSFQRQLANDLTIEFTYIYKAEKDLLTLQPYDTATGEFYEWEALPFTTWTGYETQVWQIKPKDFNGDGAVDIEDWYYVVSEDHTRYKTVNASSFAGTDTGRTYHGLQLVLNKRLSNRWQGMAAINWNKTDGFYPRVIDQTWFIDGPIVMDTYLGSSKNHYQNNTSGPAMMTPVWAVKLAGSYTVPTIETDVGFRLRYDSGVPVWAVETIPGWATWKADTEGSYLNPDAEVTMVATDPNKPDWTPPTTILDLSLQKSFKLGNVGQLNISFDALNALNSSAPNRVVYTQANYGLVSSLVMPRTYRLGVKFSF
jgi:outer membrane receptor protein involved in Fe transport